MNISNLVDMITADPTLTDDIDGFLKMLNTKNIVQIDKIRTDVIEKQSLVSIADRNGGTATAGDVQKALDYISKQPLYEAAEQAFEDTKAGIDSGDITDVSGIPLPVSKGAAVK